LLGGAGGGARARRALGPPAETLPDDHPAWALEARYLALGLVSVILTLSPERVVLGGGVLARAGLLARVRADVRD
jgi:fructokinase